MVNLPRYCNNFDCVFSNEIGSIKMAHGKWSDGHPGREIDGKADSRLAS